MTAEEFIAKFPARTEPNGGCLTDIACPACGRREGFTVDGAITARMTDEGVEDYTSGFDYNGDSWCRCDGCDHEGMVADFTVEGLDAALIEAQMDPAEVLANEAKREVADGAQE